MSRRRPVPREWREDNHWLSTESRQHYGVGGSSFRRSYHRAGGYCSCGARFGTAAGNHTMHADDVRDAWMNHVENAYYAYPKEDN